MGHHDCTVDWRCGDGCRTVAFRSAHACLADLSRATHELAVEGSDLFGQIHQLPGNCNRSIMVADEFRSPARELVGR